MSDWKKRSIERRDFRHTHSDYGMKRVKYRKKKKKEYKLYIRYQENAFKCKHLNKFWFMMGSYHNMADLTKALNDIKSKNKSQFHKIDKYKIFYKGKFCEENNISI